MCVCVCVCVDDMCRAFFFCSSFLTRSWINAHGVRHAHMVIPHNALFMHTRIFSSRGKASTTPPPLPIFHIHQAGLHPNRHLRSILPRPHSLNQSLKPPHDQNLVYIASSTYPVRKTRGQTEKKGSPHFLPQTFLNLLLLHVVLHVWILGRDRLAGSCS